MARILVIRLSALGDVAISVPLLKALAEQYPEHQFIMLSQPFAAPLFEELPSNVVNRILKVANQRTRDYINQFLKYKENSAGSIMTVEFITMKVDMNVQNAFDYIRDNCADKGTIYDCFVIDNSRKLLGVITVRELLRHKSSDIIGDFMDRNIISVKTDVDREEVARIFNEYDLLSMPVVDMSGRIVGIVTIDDVVDVMEAEATEDFQKMAALTPNEKPYMKTGVFELAKHRILWLSILMVSAFFSGMILTKYEDSFAIVPLLVTFIPMLMDTGGNAGSQVSTLIIRGMATGDIYPKDIGQIIWKEFRVSLIVGSILALFNFGRLALQYGLEGETLSIIITVCLSLMIVVILAKMLGCILPIVAKVFHMDPAIMAAPLITTIVDATSLFIYFEIASTLVASLSA